MWACVGFAVENAGGLAGPLPLHAWENEPMASPRAIVLSARSRAATIAALVVLLAVLDWIEEPRALVLHNVLHHLNILPFMLAGMIFGWRGALRALLLATILQAPSIHRHWHLAMLDAQDQIVELSIFGAAGIIAGFLSDRERLQRARVEATKGELETVYTALRENIEQMKKTERLSAAGQLSASLAHEIRNPLASISGAAGILARGQAPAASRAECVEILTAESQRLNRLLTNFLDFARPRLPRFQWADPAGLIQSVAALARHAARREDVALSIHLADSLPEIECDAEQMKQVLLNLVLNAIQAVNGRGEVAIRGFTTSEELFIEVSDGGRGIPAEDREHIFDPFFTTKENGTGLGLAVAANIVAQHGGTLTCSANERGPGTTFRVQMPFRRAAGRRTDEMQAKGVAV
jgi:signal transduction histidine kinase